MERLLMWADDFDDALAVLRVRAPGILGMLLVAAAFGGGLAALFLLGAPELLAAP
jgi:hypothetical protein